VDVLNPATQQIVARVPCTTAAEFDRAVSSSKDAFVGWAATPVIQRTRVMLKLQVRSCALSVTPTTSHRGGLSQLLGSMSSHLTSLPLKELEHLTPD
jgi:hypothetical protein